MGLGSVIGYLRTREAAHRVVPMPVMMRLLEKRVDIAYRDPVLRFQAEQHMRFLLGRSSRAADAESLARAYMLQWYKVSETMYRPWWAGSHPIDHLDRLRQAVAAKRGVIIHTLHHGQFGGLGAAFGHHGFQIHCPAHRGLTEGNTPDQRAFARLTTANGAVLIPADGSYEGLRDLCRAGRIVALTTDVRGSTRSTFLGRRVRCASGAWRLALDTGALIVPATVRPEGLYQRGTIEEPIDPSEFNEGEKLQRAILEQHEESVLAWPEAHRMTLASWQPDPDDAEDLNLEDPRLAHIRI